MAKRRVVVRAEDFWEGDLPPRCVVTGRDADRLVRMRFSNTPGWPWLLLPFGILPAIIALLFTSQKVEGLLPMSGRAVDDRRQRRRAAALLLGLALVLLLGAALLTEPLLALAGVAGLVAAAGMQIYADLRFVHVVPRNQGRYVELQRVHPDFAAAVDNRAGLGRT